MKMLFRCLGGLLVAIGLIALPLFGVWVKGAPVSRYTEFPPLTHYVEHTGFSWIAFILCALAALVLLVPLVLFLCRAWAGRPRAVPAWRFPAWGWFGVGFTAVAWGLAWTRFPWFAPLQPYTFSPLWLGYILVVNALTYRRTGACLLTARPRFFLALFPASAVFWWYFEYLNRFVQNWVYLGIENMTPVQYFWEATLPFSTVLPAVLGTHEFLAAVLGRPATSFRLPPPAHIPRRVPALLIGVSALGLAFLAVFPDLLFPLLWLSPLLLISGARMLAARPPLDAGPDNDVVRRAALLAAAALGCGFFWEMWNFYSLARWEYAVPFVNRFHIFEMPLLGYTGYFPFGIECALVGDAIRSWMDRRAAAPHP
ncbi:MAG: hypothetical protein KJ726_04895 [Verrucomicrobia bacterium]|nr:hypothetical protein [Verrucomicrobiota bacterium]MBU1909366.1 hypothetical protein [Verrucomicrobiota bacterium]